MVEIAVNEYGLVTVAASTSKKRYLNKTVFRVNILVNTLECSLHYFPDFTLWEAGVVDIGCYATGCTSADGLVVRPDSNFLWNAVVDKTKPLPYICMSNCVRGYVWIPSTILNDMLT